MSFSIEERSREDGQPIELYQFALGGDFFTYTNQESDETYGAIVYTAETISRTSIKNTIDAGENQITITVPSTNAFARLFVTVIPGDRASITIRQVHRTDTADETVVAFKGFVSTVGFGQDGKAVKINCRQITSAAERPVPRHTYQGLCNHMLYDARCGLSEATFEENATITAVDGRNVTTSGLTNVGGGDDYWEAGLCQFGSEYRLIVGQTANVMKLNIPFANTINGESLRFVPGCKHRRVTDCQTKFSNAINYGGFPFVPTKNPFETGLD